MSAKALAVLSTSAGTVAASLWAGTTTETSGSLDTVTGACPMCACSHHAKPGVTRTTPASDEPHIPPGNEGYRNLAAAPIHLVIDALRGHSARRVVAS